jgi:hypothetical protein
MKKPKIIAALCILALIMLVSVVSANPHVVQSLALAQTAEVQAVGGGSGCARAIGLGLALAAATLSPCGVLCASMAWYDLGLIVVYCG